MNKDHIAYVAFKVDETERYAGHQYVNIVITLLPLCLGKFND